MLQPAPLGSKRTRGMADCARPAKSPRAERMAEVRFVGDVCPILKVYDFAHQFFAQM